MVIDLLLAIAHHILVFSLFAMLAIEMTLVKPGLDAPGIERLARIDGGFGGIAGAVIVIGVCRVIFGLKGWEYYVGNWAFWAKMAAFLAIGLLSISPTRRFLRWRKAARADPDFAVPHAEIAPVRAYFRAEVAIFLLVLVFAAMMARGVGY